MRRLLLLSGPLCVSLIVAALAIYLATAGGIAPRTTPTPTPATGGTTVRAWAPFAWSDGTGGPTLYCMSSGLARLYPPLLH